MAYSEPENWAARSEPQSWVARSERQAMGVLKCQPMSIICHPLERRRDTSRSRSIETFEVNTNFNTPFEDSGTCHPTSNKSCHQSHSTTALQNGWHVQSVKRWTWLRLQEIFKQLTNQVCKWELRHRFEQAKSTRTSARPSTTQGRATQNTGHRESGVPTRPA